ncbi:HET-domain-containing protein [Hypoxylon sp. FL1857]|nr:HET-domain-containing protein [Hypoxylon sp. FL1857]
MTTTIPRLANLCEQCRVLEFDDSDWPGAYQAGSAGEGYYLEISKENDDPHRLNLDYFLLDSLPELPWLSDTADSGCDFCAILKKSIQKYARDCFAEVLVSLFYQWYPFGNNLGDGRRPIGLKSLLAQLLWIGYDENGQHLSRSTWLHFGIDSPHPSDPCARWLRLESSPRDDVLCTENVRMVLDNLKSSSHIRPFTKGAVYPTRLIDVGDDGASSCRLVETSSDATFAQSSQVPYAALSYCWGPPEDIVRQFKTEKGSLDDRLRSFELQEVSPILRDAILAARVLGVRYLWMDAVCIVQDDVEDWDRESSLMSLVFQNAAMTICTPASTSCQEGFLARDWIMTRIRFKSNINECVSGSYIVRLVGEVNNRFHASVECLSFALNHSNWALRGWVLQEYELSQRVVIFGRSKLHVVTGKGTQSEANEVTQLLDRAHGDRYLQQGAAGYNPYINWITLVEDYSARRLTHRTDKLPAISGLASRSLRAHSSTFLAGHLFLHIDLFWTAALSQTSLRLTRAALLDGLKSRRSYVAPSWSWASRNHPIEFGDRRFSVFEDLGPGITEECDIVRASTSLAGSNPFGGVKDGSLVIHTSTVPLSITVEPLGSVGSDHKVWRANEAGGYVADLSFDWNLFEDEESFKELSLVLIGSRKAEENLSWDPVQLVYEHEVKDEGPEGTSVVRFGMMDTWVAAGVPGHSRLGLSEDRIIYGVLPHRERGHFRVGDGEIIDGQQASRHFKEGVAGGSTNQDHDVGKGYRSDTADTHRGTGEKNLNSHGTTSESPPDNDEERYAYGIIVHPASEPGKYIRVGAFHSVPREFGGLDYFRSYQKQTLEII